MAAFKQARVASVVLLLLTLAAGVLMGMAWSERRGRAVVEPVPLEEPPTPSQAARPDTADESRDEGDRPSRQPVIYDLDLDLGQREQVDMMIQHFRQSWENLDNEMDRQLGSSRRQLSSTLRDSLKSILRPEQAVVYDSLLAERYGRDRRGRGEDRDGDRRRNQRPGNSGQK